MVICEICGSENFEKHAGFIYCAVCQTQSQDYYEQEHEYRDYELNVRRQQKSQPAINKPKAKVYDDGLWTTWEVFNYILFGMTEEMKKCGGEKEFEKMVLKLWAAYLKQNEVVFTSKNSERIPKLGFSFKQRDARVGQVELKILYNRDISINTVKKKKISSKSCSSKVSDITISSLSSNSKRSLAYHRGKIVTADYQNYLSLSNNTSYNLADATLESLGKSSDLGLTEESSDANESLSHRFSSYKNVLTKKDFKLYRGIHQTRELIMSTRNRINRDVRTPGKNKLLSILHLALLMTESPIQLSDLLRFIREGYLSFAKVTHFFPNNVKLPKKDFSYVEVISDSSMPTHLGQRKIGGQLARFLKINKIPAANVDVLVDRYCQDLNLPEQLANLSKKILRDLIPSSTVPRSKTLLPSYEAWAMVSIIFVMKLLFGLNDKTEFFLSQLARRVNSSRNSDQKKVLFVFEDWQKFIECRKTILSSFHYPTLEQLNGNSSESCEKFVNMLIKESKDEYRDERFIPYSKYFIERNFLKEIKQTLNALSRPQNVASIDFQPSLTPQVSNLEFIMRDIAEKKNSAKEKRIYQFLDFPEVILKQSFRNCDLEFAFEPETVLKSCKETKFNLYKNVNHSHGLLEADSLEKKIADDSNGLLKCSSEFWSLKYPEASSGHLGNFREEIFEKTSESFQWLMTECARMLEMNVRDIYDELLRFEEKLSTKP